MLGLNVDSLIQALVGLGTLGLAGTTYVGGRQLRAQYIEQNRPVWKFSIGDSAAVAENIGAVRALDVTLVAKTKNSGDVRAGQGFVEPGKDLTATKGEGTNAVPQKNRPSQVGEAYLLCGSPAGQRLTYHFIDGHPLTWQESQPGTTGRGGNLMRVGGLLILVVAGALLLSVRMLQQPAQASTPPKFIPLDSRVSPPCPAVDNPRSECRLTLVLRNDGGPGGGAMVMSVKGTDSHSHSCLLAIPRTEHGDFAEASCAILLKVGDSSLGPDASPSRRQDQADRRLPISDPDPAAPVLTTVLTTTPVDVRGRGDTQRTIRRIELPVRLHSSVGRAADS